jgi:hypothetical protein
MVKVISARLPYCEVNHPTPFAYLPFEASFWPFSRSLECFLFSTWSVGRALGRAKPVLRLFF